jgi:hypothetical protein
MSSIYLPASLKTRLICAARRHGFVVERGRQSQLTEFIVYLLALDERVGQAARQRRHTLNTALGLLAQPGQRTPSDAEVDEILDLRRMSQ